MQTVVYYFISYYSRVPTTLDHGFWFVCLSGLYMCTEQLTNFKLVWNETQHYATTMAHPASGKRSQRGQSFSSNWQRRDL